MSDLDLALLDFIKTNVSSFIKWDLLRFFYENRHIMDTVENIATYIGRRAAVIEPELIGLVASHIIVKREMDGISTYSFTNDEIILVSVRKFILACEDKELRIKVVYHISQGDAKRSSVWAQF